MNGEKAVEAVGKSYKKEFDYSYTLGASPTMELLTVRPESALRLFVDQSFTVSTAFSRLDALASQYGIPLELNDKIIRRLSPKENVFVIGAFQKYETELERDNPHIVLVNPSDMGNVGTIIRTAAGFGLQNIAVIRPGIDFFHPKTVRSSMGAIFRVNCAYYDSFTDYTGRFLTHGIFPFMTDGAITLQSYEHDGSLYALVFGNEATGLDQCFSQYGTSIRIRHDKVIDSLNLANAVGIAIFAFTKQNYCDIISS